MDSALLVETYGRPACVERLVPVEPETKTITLCIPWFWASGSIGIEKIEKGFHVFPALQFLTSKRYEGAGLAAPKLVRVYPGACINTSLVSESCLLTTTQSSFLTIIENYTKHGERLCFLLFQKGIFDADMWSWRRSRTRKKTIKRGHVERGAGSNQKATPTPAMVPFKNISPMYDEHLRGIARIY
jgi:hypothetical protein